jgi:hypothetical protein
MGTGLHKATYFSSNVCAMIRRLCHGYIYGQGLGLSVLTRNFHSNVNSNKALARDSVCEAAESF